MNPAGHKLVWLIAGAVGCLLPPAARPADAAEAEIRVPADAVPAISGRPAAAPESPVETFRKLLAMSPAERDQFLNHYPAASRERILEKLQEYQILPVELRELRLQVTELRWYLLPLMRMSPARRAEQLNMVPESCRELVAARLEQWEVLPPSLKDEVLEYETTMQYFVGRNAGGHAVIQRQVVVEDVPEKERPALERKLARWQALPPIQRQQMYASFEQYFQLSEDEKQRTLDALSESQRQEAEKVLEPIEKWPRAQQARYVAAFRKFADMSPAERDWFMKNAGRWQRMSAAERQAWRDLVQQLSDLPILPPGAFQPRPLSTAPGLPGPVRTNPTAAPLK
jgi:hypothetical protein